MKLLILFLTLNSLAYAEDFNYIPYLESYAKALKESKTIENTIYQERLNKIVVRTSKIDEIPDYYVGICNMEKNIILINPNHFATASELKRQELFDHEMSHCILLRSHHNISTITYQGEVPDDIMHHTIFEYKDHKQMKEMRKKLFNPQFYGTQLEVEKLYVHNNADEVIISAANPYMPQAPNIAKLRQIEHYVMQSRIEKYNKGK